MIDPEIKDYALQLLKKGKSAEKVAAECGVDANSVRAWARDAGVKMSRARKPRVASDSPAQGADVSAEMAALFTATEGGAADKDTLTRARQLLQRIEDMSRLAATSGDESLTSKLTRDALNAMVLVARIEKSQREDGGIVVSLDELRAAYDLVLERVRAITDRPLLCAHCNRALSVQWAGGRDKTDDQSAM